MKIGYSNLLGEYLSAAALEYKDCERFQVVCPACREPVFKVTGQRYENNVEYLSHYRQDISYDGGCELRVGSLHDAQISANNHQAREQKLQYFLSVFRDILLKNEYFEDSRARAIRSLSEMNRSKSLAQVRGDIFNVCKTSMGQSLGEEQFYGYCQDYVNDISSVSGEFFETSFSIHVQKRIARDIWLSLITNQGKDNWDFLFNYSWMHLISRIEKARSTRAPYPWEIFLIDRMKKLLKANKSNGLAILSEIWAYPMHPPFAMQGHCLMQKMAGELTHEMLGTLIRLPYCEYLKEQSSKSGNGLVA
jgi:hypothetical protein